MAKVVLSLFNGMNCGEIALIEAKVPYSKYYYSEVDKHANIQTNHNFPNSIALGDVRLVDVSKLDPIDVLIGGSPCTDLSFAGKGSGLICNTLKDYLEMREEWIKTGNDDLYFHNGKFQQSILFWEYLRILNDIKKYNPDVKFLLENVRMKKEHERTINESLGLYPVAINSNLVSAQNRYRLYWTNIRTRSEGLFGDTYSDIPQPKDQKIFLKDILQPESEIDEKYYIKNPKIDFKGIDINGKTKTLRTGGQATQSEKHNYDIIKVDREGNVKADQDKASCFTAGGHSAGNHSDMDVLCIAMRGRNTDGKNEQKLEPNYDGKTNCITSVSKDNLVVQLNPSKESGGKQPYQHNRVYDADYKSPTLNTDERAPIVYQKPNDKSGISREIIQQTVRVRKYEVDIKALKILLKSSKKSSGKTIAAIAKECKVLKTKAEHWFRSDKSFAIPDEENWLDIKDCIGIKTDSFDSQIMEFIEKPNEFDTSNRAYDVNGKSPSLTCANDVKIIEKDIRDSENLSVVDFSHKNEGIRYYKDKCPTMNARDYKEPRCITDGYRLRRLTPTECARLQNIPEWYEWIVSESQQYKMLGNGWTVGVIVHIFSYL